MSLPWSSRLESPYASTHRMPAPNPVVRVLLALAFIRPRVEVNRRALVVTLGWSFRVAVPRTAITAVDSVPWRRPDIDAEPVARALAGQHRPRPAGPRADRAGHRRPAARRTGPRAGAHPQRRRRRDVPHRPALRPAVPGSPWRAGEPALPPVGSPGEVSVRPRAMVNLGLADPAPMAPSARDRGGISTAGRGGRLEGWAHERGGGPGHQGLDVGARPALPRVRVRRGRGAPRGIAGGDPRQRPRRGRRC